MTFAPHAASPAGQSIWRRPSVLVLSFFCLLAAGYSLTYYCSPLFSAKHRPLVRGIDNNYYFFWLSSAVIDHDLDFTNQLAGSPTLSEADRRAEFAVPLTATGHRYNKFPVGWALGSAPWFVAAHALSLACGWPTTGWEPPYQIAIWLGQLAYAAMGIAFAWRILLRFFPPLESAWALLFGWLASPLVYYQTAGLSMTHSLVFSLAAAAIWLGLRLAEKPQTGGFAWLGLVAGLLAITRYTSVVYLLIPLATVAPLLSSAPASHRLRAAAAFSAGMMPPLLLQCAAWKMVYGSWFVYSYGSEGFQFSSPHLWDVLFSPLHGFFYWHPLMAVGTVGLVAWSITDRRRAPWLAVFVTTWLLNGFWWCWWFGSSFGNRGFEGCGVLAMAGLGWLFTRSSRRQGLRRGLLCFCAAAAAWNVLVLALFLTKQISNESAVTWADMARACLPR